MTFVKCYTGLLRSARSWGVLGLVLAIAAVFVLTLVSPAMANKVHAETKVFKRGIRRDHCDKTSGDANRNYVICYSSHDSSWAYAKEGWLYTGGQYILDNYFNSYRQSNKYSTYTHAHHHITSPDDGGGPDQPPPKVPPPGTPGTIAFTHIHYKQVGQKQITIDLVPETFLQISLADLEPGESDSTTLTQVVDGSVSQVVLSGRGGPKGPDIQVTRTGLFKSVPFSIKPFPNHLYALHFDAPLHFTVNATLASELNLEGGDVSEPPPVGKCDLEARKSVSPNPATSGQPVTIALTVTNVGTGPCDPDTVVQDPRPAGLTFTAPPVANQRGWACSLPGGNASCVTAGTLPPGYTATFTFPATVTAPPGGTSTNCATVSNPADINLANNQSCVTIQVKRGVGPSPQPVEPKGSPPPPRPFDPKGLEGR